MLLLTFLGVTKNFDFQWHFIRGVGISGMAEKDGHFLPHSKNHIFYKKWRGKDWQRKESVDYSVSCCQYICKAIVKGEGRKNCHADHYPPSLL